MGSELFGMDVRDLIFDPSPHPFFRAVPGVLGEYSDLLRFGRSELTPGVAPDNHPKRNREILAGDDLPSFVQHLEIQCDIADRPLTHIFNLTEHFTGRPVLLKILVALGMEGDDLDRKLLFSGSGGIKRP